MRITDVVYFAPNFTFYQLFRASPTDVVDAFDKRIEEYYLKPAEILNQNSKGFGAGVLCITAIDAIAKYELGGSSSNRFKKWISKLQDFKELKWEYIERIYKEFRNGLVHEGRVKNGGQFSYDADKAVIIKEDVIFINPKLLLEQLRNGFNRYIKYLKSNEYETQRFSDKIKRDFKHDLEPIHLRD